MSKPDAPSRASALSAAGWTKAAIGYREGQTITIDWRWATNRDLAQRHFFGGSGEFELAVDTMQRERTQAVIVQPLFTLGQSGPVAELLARRRLPTSSALRPFAVAGGLMAYGPSRADTFRRTASFVDRVLKGTTPASLPVEEPTSYELVFNLATAKALGITVSPAMRLRADEVIE